MFARAAATAVSRSGARTITPAVSAIRGRAFSTTTPTSAIFTNHFLSGVVTAAGAIGAVGIYTYFQAKQHPVFAETKPLAGIKGQSSERTFIAVKPDGVQRGLVGKIVSRFEERGYKLVAIKAVVPSRALAEEHYADLRPRPFFKGLVDYMTNGKAPVVAMVWEGKDVIRQGRAMIGATNPLDSAPGSIRGQYCISVGRNIIHGSDSYESAAKEIVLWFGKPGDIINWEPANWVWTMAEN